jgi:hypothetical protein
MAAGWCLCVATVGCGYSRVSFSATNFGANAIQTKGETGVYKIPLRVYMNAQFFFWIKICGG